MHFELSEDDDIYSIKGPVCGVSNLQVQRSDTKDRERNYDQAEGESDSNNELFGLRHLKRPYEPYG